MANGAYDDGILRIGPPAPPPAPGQGGRYCAEASLVFSVLGLVCFYLGVGSWGLAGLLLGAFVCSPLAAILGLIGRRRGGESKVVANCAILMIFPGVFLLCSLPVNEARTAARHSQFIGNMKQVGLALLNYHEEYGRLPPAAVRDREGRPLYSWRVLILPFLGADDLYREFHLEERWDSPHNRTLLDRGPRLYRKVGAEDDSETSFIQVFVGPGSAFESPNGEPFTHPDGASNFPDGLSDTILAVEAREGVPWSAPFDLPTGPELPPVALGGGYLRQWAVMNGEPAVKEFQVLFADQSVRPKRWPVDSRVLRAWVTRNGGETVPVVP